MEGIPPPPPLLDFRRGQYKRRKKVRLETANRGSKVSGVFSPKGGKNFTRNAARENCHRPIFLFSATICQDIMSLLARPKSARQEKLKDARPKNLRYSCEIIFRRFRKFCTSVSCAQRSILSSLVDKRPLGETSSSCWHKVCEALGVESGRERNCEGKREVSPLLLPELMVSRGGGGRVFFSFAACFR